MQSLTPCPAADQPCTPASRDRLVPSWPGACAILLFAAFLWGAGNVANKTALEDVDPYTAVTLRCLLAAMVMLPLLLLEPRATNRRAWRTSALGIGVLFAGALLLQQIAYQSTSVTNASFLVNTASVMTPAFAWLWLRDKPPRCIFIAGGATLLGAFLMSGADFRLSSLNAGDVACLGSAALYAAWMVMLGQHAMRHGCPFRTSFVQFLVAALLVAPMALRQIPDPAALIRALPEIMVLGIFSTAAAFALLSYAQRYVSASAAAVLVSAESIFGAAGGALLLGERVSMTALAGAVFIMGAILAVALAAGSSSWPAIRSADQGPA